MIEAEERGGMGNRIQVIRCVFQLFLLLFFWALVLSFVRSFVRSFH